MDDDRRERLATLHTRRADLEAAIAASQAESARIRAERLPLVEARDAIDREIAKADREASRERARKRRDVEVLAAVGETVGNIAEAVASLQPTR